MPTVREPKSDGAPQDTAGRNLNWYATVAILFFNTFLLFVGVNLVLAAAQSWSNRPSGAQIDRRTEEQLKAAYPDWSRDELAILLEEKVTAAVSDYEPFTQFRPRVQNGVYTHFSPDGFRPIANQGPWPLDEDAVNVFVFGGSTTFGHGVADFETIPSHLQVYLRDGTDGVSVNVYNFARPSYFSTQERILFEQLILSGQVPDIAVFVDGLNDFSTPSGVPDETATLTDYVNSLNASPPSLAGQFMDFIDSMEELPMGRAAAHLRERLQENRSQQGEDQTTNKRDPSRYSDEAVLQTVISRYVTNKHMIEGVATEFDIATMFVWQPVPTYEYDDSYHAFVHDGFFGKAEFARNGYPMMADLRDAGDLGDDFFWLADMQADRHENLYVDDVHYTSAFSRDIAREIYNHTCEQGLLPMPCDLQPDAP